MKPIRVDSKYQLIKKLHNLYRFLFTNQSEPMAVNLTYLSFAVLVFTVRTLMHFSYKHLLRIFILLHDERMTMIG